eukprot:gene41231-51041_t
MHLPFGLYETVMEYLPLPRVWKWSLPRIERRIELDARQAILDMSCVVDEILCDANIISGLDQTQLLVKAQQYLLLQRKMPIQLLQKLCQWEGSQGDLCPSPRASRQMLATTEVQDMSCSVTYCSFRLIQQVTDVILFTAPKADVKSDH